MGSKTPLLIGGLALAGIGAYFYLRHDQPAATPPVAAGSPQLPPPTGMTPSPIPPLFGLGGVKQVSNIPPRELTSDQKNYLMRVIMPQMLVIGGTTPSAFYHLATPAQGQLPTALAILQGYYTPRSADNTGPDAQILVSPNNEFSATSGDIGMNTGPEGWTTFVRDKADWYNLLHILYPTSTA